MCIYGFSESLKDLLTDLGYNIEAFSKEAGVGRSDVYHWLKGDYNPSPRSLIRIAEKYNVSVDYMFGFSDRKELIFKKSALTFYERFTRSRMLAGFSCYKIWQECGIGQAAMSRWKTQGCIPETEVFLKLAKCLGCTLDYLLGIGE